MPKINQEEHEVLKGLDDKWKWMARDRDRLLFVFNVKPLKGIIYAVWDIAGWDDDDDCLEIENSDLFQFIQWEDEEPYNIQELIEEYDNWVKDYEVDWNKVFGREESEETEVKKDKEWVIEEIKKERNLLNDTRYEVEVDDLTTGVLMGMKRALIILNQFEEPEVFSQELPVIPRFVADWIEGNKQFEEKWNDYSKEDAMNDTIHFTVYGLFADYPATNSHVELRKPVLKWLSVDRGNYFKLVNAVRYGYEVEEEQKYYAKIKGHENISSDDKYWNYCIADESLDIGDNKVHADVLDEYVLSATKDEWENLGINDDNADFVKVEELKE